MKTIARSVCCIVCVVSGLYMSSDAKDAIGLEGACFELEDR